MYPSSLVLFEVTPAAVYGQYCCTYIMQFILTSALHDMYRTDLFHSIYTICAKSLVQFSLYTY